MRWKELAIGAAITLLVTIVGGLIVFFFTQEPRHEKSETLHYSLDEQVSFQGKDNKFSIGKAQISNVGNMSAENVKAIFSLKEGVFLEYYASSDSGADVAENLNDDKTTLSLSLPSLLPDEKISITFMLSQKSKPNVVLRSNDSVGKLGLPYRIVKSKKSLLNEFLGDFVPYLIIVTMFPIFIFIRYIRKAPRRSSKNNNGFVLLHKGLIEEATQIFNTTVENGEDGSIGISNYALCVALSGNIDKAKSYIKAAEFLSNQNHEKAVVSFNKSLIEKISGHEDLSIENMSKALNLSKKEIVNYCKNSVVVSQCLEDSALLKDLVENA